MYLIPLTWKTFLDPSPLLTLFLDPLRLFSWPILSPTAQDSAEVSLGALVGFHPGTLQRDAGLSWLQGTLTAYVAVFPTRL